LSQKTPKVDFSSNPMHEPKFVFYDMRLKNLVDSNDPNAVEFFTCLALCHTVMPAEKDGRLPIATSFGIVNRVKLIIVI
jgi:hypothetical protein